MTSTLASEAAVRTAVISRRIEETLSRLIERGNRRDAEGLPGLRGAKKPTEEVLIRAAA